VLDDLKHYSHVETGITDLGYAMVEVNPDALKPRLFACAKLLGSDL
jgi:hypothetical protein